MLWKKNRLEDFKTALELRVADRGGLILDPVVGIHEGVVEVDFASLYPSIMSVHNISPETVLCSCCPDSRHRVPELLYPICEKRKGIIARVVGSIVRRRMAYKRLIKAGEAKMDSPSSGHIPSFDPSSYDSLREESESYKGRAKALKWLLVTCFGYTGYKNARFGRIE